MRKTILFSALVLGLGVLLAYDRDHGDTTLHDAANLVVPAALAQDPAGAKSCSIIGSWYGYYAHPDDVTPRWMTTVEGHTPESGTAVLELIGFDSTLGGIFPTAVGGSLIRGTWKKIGPNTFAITALGFGIDAAGNNLYIAKMTGIDTLSDNCNKVTVNVKLQLLSPTFEPWGLPVPQEEHYGYRILVEE